MAGAKSNPFLSLLVDDSNYGPLIILQKNSVVSNAAIVVLTSSAAAVLPASLSRQPTAGSGIDGWVVQAILFGSLRNLYSALVVCIMFAFACAFSSMLLLPKRPKASRLLHISAAFWLSSAFTTLLFSAVIRN